VILPKHSRPTTQGDSGKGPGNGGPPAYRTMVDAGHGRVLWVTGVSVAAHRAIVPSGIFFRCGPENNGGALLGLGQQLAHLFVTSVTLRQEAERSYNHRQL
jgi:hypothetical protein